LTSRDHTTSASTGARTRRAPTGFFMPREASDGESP